MKRFIALLIAMALLLSVCAAAESVIAEDWVFPDSEDEETGLLDDADTTGMWEYTDMETCKGGEALQELFDKAMEGMIGVTYTPAAVLATQVASGNNYCILCFCDYTDNDFKETGWSLVYINEAFGGDAQVTNVVDIDIADLADYGILH